MVEDTLTLKGNIMIRLLQDELDKQEVQAKEYGYEIDDAEEVEWGADPFDIVAAIEELDYGEPLNRKHSSYLKCNCCYRKQ
jgi:hypothetical protein